LYGGDPIRLRREQIEAGVDRIAARRHFLKRAQVLLAAAARIVDLQLRIVAYAGKELAVEERAVIGELRRLIAVAETA
jgi:hypothetical protein